MASSPSSQIFNFKVLPSHHRWTSGGDERGYTPTQNWNNSPPGQNQVPHLSFNENWQNFDIIKYYILSVFVLQWSNFLIFSSFYSSYRFIRCLFTRFSIENHNSTFFQWQTKYSLATPALFTPQTHQSKSAYAFHKDLASRQCTRR